MNEKEQIARIKELERQIRMEERAVLPGYEDETVTEVVPPSISTNELATVINSVVDWNRFFRLVRTIGQDCNARQDRFEKGELLEEAVEIYSGGFIKYIGKDGDDGDLELTVDGSLIRIEQKFVANGLWSPLGKPSKSLKRQSIRNFQGKGFYTIPENFPDFLMIVAVNGSAIISKYDFVTKHGLEKADDALYARYYMTDLTILHGPVLNVDYKLPEKSYRSLKKDLHTRYINSIE